MADVIYMTFPDRETAIATLTDAGAEISEWGDHFTLPCGWGTIFNVADKAETFVNLYDGVETGFEEYIIQAPNTPYNVRA